MRLLSAFIMPKFDVVFARRAPSRDRLELAETDDRCDDGGRRRVPAAMEWPFNMKELISFGGLKTSGVLVGPDHDRGKSWLSDGTD